MNKKFYHDFEEGYDGRKFYISECNDCDWWVSTEYPEETLEEEDAHIEDCTGGV